MDFAENLKHKIEFNLPGEDFHLPMSPLYRMRSSEGLAQNPNFKDSAVAVILFFENDQQHIILTQRNEYEGQHSGQISFPGGKKEQSDTDLKATALRESKEEIGIESSTITFLGAMTPVYIPVSNFKMSPFVFYSSDRPIMIKDDREVAEIISILVNELLHEDNIGVTEILMPDKKLRNDIPCFYLKNKIVWGATALVLNELKALLQ